MGVCIYFGCPIRLRHQLLCIYVSMYLDFLLLFIYLFVYLFIILLCVWFEKISVFLTFVICFNVLQAGSKVLQIQVLCGTNLAKKDIFGASDPYVKITLYDSKSYQVIEALHTKTKKRTLNPHWHETFHLRVSMILSVMLQQLCFCFLPLLLKSL
uniref:C2 domain-containing protein n=1 Tax=Eptatretus burgeri TaxID=7764 RepID=A0A8C4N5T8_EPTBU